MRALTIKMASEDGNERRVWVRPEKTIVHVGAYMDDAAVRVKRFEETGLATSLRRGNKTAPVTIRPKKLQDSEALLTEFIRDAFAEDSIQPV